MNSIDGEYINATFIDYKFGNIIECFPSECKIDDFKVGQIIPVHYFIGGWHYYKIKKIVYDNPIKIYVKRNYFVLF